MNMKKDKRITLSTWWKNFLTGVLATAIGVGLTFEVNNRVEYHKQKQAQRQAAMMAIYDIDEIIRQFNWNKQREDAFFKVAMYMFTHPEELETVAMDSLWMTAEYITFNSSDMPDWSDDSTEKVFTSSMDALRNLGDIMFYDNVQECYRQRRNILRHMENSTTFRRPVSEEFVLEYRKHVSAANKDYTGMMNQSAMAGLIRQMFAAPEVALYLQKYLTRDRYYQGFLDKLICLNQENKFIMNITDEDMTKYVAQHVNQTMPAKAKLIVGRWDMSQNNQHKMFDLRKDRTATLQTQMNYKIGFHVEEEDVNVSMFAPMTFTIDGQWTLDGDSLRMNFNPETVQILSFDLDLNSLPKAALERAKDSLDSRKQQYREAVLKQLQQHTKWTWVNKVSLGKTGKIMFWEEEYTMPWGQTQTDKTQLLKIQEP